MTATKQHTSPRNRESNKLTAQPKDASELQNQQATPLYTPSERPRGLSLNDMPLAKKPNRPPV